MREIDFNNPDPNLVSSSIHEFLMLADEHHIESWILQGEESDEPHRIDHLAAIFPKTLPDKNIDGYFVVLTMHAGDMTNMVIEKMIEELPIQSFLDPEPANADLFFSNANAFEEMHLPIMLIAFSHNENDPKSKKAVLFHVQGTTPEKALSWFREEISIRKQIVNQNGGNRVTNPRLALKDTVIIEPRQHQTEELNNFDMCTKFVFTESENRYHMIIAKPDRNIYEIEITGILSIMPVLHTDNSMSFIPNIMSDIETHNQQLRIASTLHVPSEITNEDTPDIPEQFSKNLIIQAAHNQPAIVLVLGFDPQTHDRCADISFIKGISTVGALKIIQDIALNELGVH